MTDHLFPYRTSFRVLDRPDARVLASDSSAQALDVAQQNAQTLGAAVEFFHGNWYDALPDVGAFDLIVSNPPYIAASDQHLRQGDLRRSEEHTSELQSLMRISYAVFCLTKKNTH